MDTEFEVIYSEFSAELDALMEAARAPQGGQPSATVRQRIAAANGATLLLAATFEEYIRQQVRAAYREKTKSANDMEELPGKIASTVWRRSLLALARTPFKEIESDIQRIDAHVMATLSFCLRKDFTADVGETLSHNENNMRPDQLNSLFNGIGVKSVMRRSCEYRELINHLGVDTPGKANSVLTSKFEEFYRRRNSIAHALRLTSSSGPAELEQDIQLFRIFGHSLSKTLAKVMKPKSARATSPAAA